MVLLCRHHPKQQITPEAASPLLQIFLFTFDPCIGTIFQHLHDASLRSATSNSFRYNHIAHVHACLCDLYWAGGLFWNQTCLQFERPTCTAGQKARWARNVLQRSYSIILRTLHAWGWSKLTVFNIGCPVLTPIKYKTISPYARGRSILLEWNSLRPSILN